MTIRVPFILALLLAAPALARAEDVPALSSEPTASLLPPPAKSDSRWYGEPMLITDSVTFANALVGTGLFFAGLQSEESGGNAGGGGLGIILVFTSGLVFAFSGPIAHADHHHWGLAGASLGLRLGLPFLAGLAGAGLGMLASSSDPGQGAGPGEMIGIGVGVVGAMLIDDLLLARDDAPRADAKSSTAFQILPTFAPIKDGASVGVVGVF